PRARPDASRYRRAGRPRDRSGNAALLSPLRSRPALRRAGQNGMARAAGDGRRAQPDSSAYLIGVRAPGKKRERRAASQTLCAPLAGHVELQAQADGNVAALFGGHSVPVGTLGPIAAARIPQLRIGLPLASFAAARAMPDTELFSLLRRLARHGFVEFALPHA